MNATQNKKYESLELRLIHRKPRSTSDLHIYFMECMEQIEFAGNNAETREVFFKLFKTAGTFWFPTEHPADLFDRIYNDTEELVAA
jgi:hypothetical protein